MRGVQTDMGAAHAVSSVEARKAGERWARKKEALFCRRRERGAHERNVLLERKVVKKAGQELEVKLLPREVSKGEGSGVVITVVDGTVARLVVVVAFDVGEADEEGMVMVVDTEVAEVDEDALDVEDESCPTCRRSSSGTGSDLVSKCISPLSSNSRN